MFNDDEGKGKKFTKLVLIEDRTLWHEKMLLCGNVLFHTTLVPGHRGFEVNGKADQLAKEGVKTPFDRFRASL